MPVLKNARHESMAQALAKGKTADDAYASAGFAPHRGNASRLSANENIRRRVDEILSRVAEKAEWTAADRLRSLKVIHDAALADERRTAIAAIAEANKMDGAYAPSKHEHKGQITVINVTPEQLGRLSADELAALETAYPVLQKLGLVAPGDTSGEAGEGSEPEN